MCTSFSDSTLMFVAPATKMFPAASSWTRNFLGYKKKEITIYSRNNMTTRSTWSRSGSKRSMISSLYSCKTKDEEQNAINSTNFFANKQDLLQKRKGRLTQVHVCMYQGFMQDLLGLREEGMTLSVHQWITIIEGGTWHAPRKIPYTRSLSWSCTCAYRSNSAYTGAKKRAVPISESISRSRPSYTRPHLSSSTWQLANLSASLDLG